MSLIMLSPWIGATSFAIGAIFLASVPYFVLRKLMGAHLSEDTAALSTSVITRLGTLHGLILALMFAQEMQNYLEVGNTYTKEAGASADVFHKLDAYDPESPQVTAATRLLIALYVQDILDKERALLTEGKMSRAAWDKYARIDQDLRKLQAADDRQKELRSEMLKAWDAISEYRRAYQVASVRKVPTFFWVLAILGFVSVTIPFYVFSPGFANIFILTVFAASTGIVIYFIYAMGNPFTGAAAIEPIALERLSAEFTAGFQGSEEGR